MKRDFCRYVDPIFLSVLELLARIDEGKSPDHLDERAKIKGKLDRAESKIGQSPEWVLAKYAIVAWVDEMLGGELSTYGDKWREKTLEFEEFRTAERSHLFYKFAHDAAGMQAKDALECFFIAVVLGFRGLYRDPAAFAEEKVLLEFELPPTLEGWVRQTAEQFYEMSRELPRLEAYPPKPVAGAPPHDGKFLSVGSWSLAVGLSALLLGLWYYNNQS